MSFKPSTLSSKANKKSSDGSFAYKYALNGYALLNWALATNTSKSLQAGEMAAVRSK
jgi:hypothetical protein